MNRRMMTLVGVLSALVMIFAMCGCGSSEEPAPTEETTQATEATTQVETTTQASDQQEIGEEQAIAIALKDAGFAESDVTYPHVHLDMDDGARKLVSLSDMLLDLDVVKGRAAPRYGPADLVKILRVLILHEQGYIADPALEAALEGVKALQCHLNQDRTDHDPAHYIHCQQ